MTVPFVRFAQETAGLSENGLKLGLVVGGVSLYHNPSTAL